MELLRRGTVAIMDKDPSRYSDGLLDLERAHALLPSSFVVRKCLTIAYMARPTAQRLQTARHVVAGMFADMQSLAAVRNEDVTVLFALRAYVAATLSRFLSSTQRLALPAEDMSLLCSGLDVDTAIAFSEMDAAYSSVEALNRLIQQRRDTRTVRAMIVRMLRPDLSAAILQAVDVPLRTSEDPSEDEPPCCTPSCTPSMSSSLSSSPTSSGLLSADSSSALSIDELFASISLSCTSDEAYPT